MTDLKALYEIDDSQWIEETIALLKIKAFHHLDLDNLVEELEDLGREKRNAVVSLLEQVIRHLLFLDYWTSEAEYNSVHWQGELYTFRVQLKRKLTTNLRHYLQSELDSIYQDALGFVKIKTQNKVEFPEDCPYALNELLEERGS
ncbi:DUF29 domain-containing protein [Roseofilum casamattae]|uniref:DUF29 domain-containing protein n=1 Tax=Roseofilum casamattae BLCC-M143 TaxID=3022442 RepID=A0ABT7BXH3_9CYAN|nr:DUF29 domain-containing protein [Roseofilum casamattae]MDJ1183885.1 DUF29 domain-containing protein [Roseofilum casamattae BLCC-M143]